VIEVTTLTIESLTPSEDSDGRREAREAYYPYQCTYPGCTTRSEVKIRFCDPHQREFVGFVDLLISERNRSWSSKYSNEDWLFFYRHLDLMRARGLTNLREDCELLSIFRSSTRYPAYALKAQSDMKFLQSCEPAPNAKDPAKRIGGCSVEELKRRWNLTDYQIECLCQKFKVKTITINGRKEYFLDYLALSEIVETLNNWLEISDAFGLLGISYDNGIALILEHFLHHNRFGPNRTSLFTDKPCIRNILLPLIGKLIGQLQKVFASVNRDQLTNEYKHESCSNLERLEGTRYHETYSRRYQENLEFIERHPYGCCLEEIRIHLAVPKKAALTIVSNVSTKKITSLGTWVFFDKMVKILSWYTNWVEVFEATTNLGLSRNQRCHVVKMAKQGLFGPCKVSLSSLARLCIRTGNLTLLEERLKAISSVNRPPA